MTIGFISLNIEPNESVQVRTFEYNLQPHIPLDSKGIFGCTPQDSLHQGGPSDQHPHPPS
jgi:hypothetical protein